MAPCAGVARAGVAAEERQHGSHLRPHPHRETIEGSIGIYISRSTRSGIERGASRCVTISINLPFVEIQYLAQSRAKRNQPIIRSKCSLYEDMCSTLNRLQTPRWADTTRIGSALHPTRHTEHGLATHGPAPGAHCRRPARTVDGRCTRRALLPRCRACDPLARPPIRRHLHARGGVGLRGTMQGGVARRGELGRQPGHAPAQRGRSRRHPARQRRCLKCLMISAPSFRPARLCGGARGRTSAAS